MPGLQDFLRNWSQRRTPTPATQQTQPTQTNSYDVRPPGMQELVPITDPSWKGYTVIPNTNPPMVQLANGVTIPLAALQASKAAAGSKELEDQYNSQNQIPLAYRQEFQELQSRYYAGGMNPEKYKQYVAALQALKAKYNIGDEGRQNPQPNLPPAGSLDPYNPGPYIAQLLRGQLPGYVFGTRVPRPNQITLSEFLKLNPTQQQVLTSYVSALGIPPEDFLGEVQQYWLKGSPGRQISWQS